MSEQIMWAVKGPDGKLDASMIDKTKVGAMSRAAWRYGDRWVAAGVTVVKARVKVTEVQDGA